ncbi:hypothetical protein Hanom_Chr16g01443421 [Helianthus anomalus]
MHPRPALWVSFSWIRRHWSQVGRSPVDNPLYKYLSSNKNTSSLTFYSLFYVKFINLRGLTS